MPLKGLSSKVSFTVTMVRYVNRRYLLHDSLIEFYFSTFTRLGRLTYVQTNEEATRSK